MKVKEAIVKIIVKILLMTTTMVVVGMVGAITLLRVGGLGVQPHLPPV